MLVSAHDVAREIRDRLPTAGVVKTHKLLYYSYGWYAAWTARELFVEDIQAWSNGPVVADLWHDEDKGRPAPDAVDLDSEMLMAISYVVSRYGGLSGRELIDLTHTELPWKQAWDRAENTTIALTAIRTFFAEESDEDSIELDPAEARRLAEAHVMGYPSSGPVKDDTEALRRMLASSAR